mmetsp:Transcript_7148/g.15410  ORF Transcript_7148/g.15410 Transcript_7148/m.15410 type:complete len:269 (+) Transcript_7148:597-1403(+)
MHHSSTIVTWISSWRHCCITRHILLVVVVVVLILLMMLLMLLLLLVLLLLLTGFSRTFSSIHRRSILLPSRRRYIGWSSCVWWMSNTNSAIRHTVLLLAHLRVLLSTHHRHHSLHGSSTHSMHILRTAHPHVSPWNNMMHPCSTVGRRRILILRSLCISGLRNRRRGSSLRCSERRSKRFCRRVESERFGVRVKFCGCLFLFRSSCGRCSGFILLGVRVGITLMSSFLFALTTRFQFVFLLYFAYSHRFCFFIYRFRRFGIFGLRNSL